MTTKTTVRVFAHMLTDGDTFTRNGVSRTVAIADRNGPTVWVYYTDGEADCLLAYDTINID